MPEWLRIVIKLAAYGAAVVMMLSVSYANERIFSLGFSNIIILVLANMAIFGSIVYIFTANKPIVRIAILPFLMAILFTRMDVTSDGWQKWLMYYSPLPWLYNMYYLKYLFIVIPGSIAGEYLLDWINKPNETVKSKDEIHTAWFTLVVSVGLVVLNLYGLFTRQLVLNLFGTAALLSVGYIVLKKSNTVNTCFWKQLFTAGAYLLMLGLFFESFEGGIRKDHSTFSYYFVTSGLAFMALTAFSIMCDFFKWNKATSFLVMSGQNPMIAYVGSSMVVGPILCIVGIWSYINMLNQTAIEGLMRGLIITGLVTLITMFFTKIKWFWRT